MIANIHKNKLDLTKNLDKCAGVINNCRADVAELADAQDSGSCDRKVVQVQVLSSAPPKT